MKTETLRSRCMWNIKVLRIWSFFVVLLVVLICSAVLGTQSVRASACTPAQCNSAQIYAYYACMGHGGVQYVWCPYSNEPDDFIFFCVDLTGTQNDCGTNAPS